MIQTPPFPNAQVGRGKCETTAKLRGAAGRHGTLRNLTERLNLAIPYWGPPYFCGFSLNRLTFYAPDAPPFPNTQAGEVGGGGAILPSKQMGPRDVTERYGT